MSNATHEDKTIDSFEWRFGVVGNIVKTHLDEDGILRYGTIQFTGGTKVYIDGKNWSNLPRTEIVVIGLNRFKRFEIAAVPPELIENVRFQIIRNRTVLNILSGEEAVDGWHFWGRLSSDRREAKEFANNWEEIVSVAERNRNQDRE